MALLKVHHAPEGVCRPSRVLARSSIRPPHDTPFAESFLSPASAARPHEPQRNAKQYDSGNSHEPPDQRARSSGLGASSWFRCRDWVGAKARCCRPVPVPTKAVDSPLLAEFGCKLVREHVVWPFIVPNSTPESMIRVLGVPERDDDPS
jgi:hypothetical protein